MLKQRTIKKSVKARGVGIHSGKQVNMTLIPAGSDHGVVFRRLDAGGRQVHAHSAFVNEVVLSTGLESQGVKVSTIEHLICLLYTSPSPRDATLSRMPSSA